MQPPAILIQHIILDRGDFCTLHVSHSSQQGREFLATVIHFDQSIIVDALIARHFTSEISEEHVIDQAISWIERDLSSVVSRFEIPQILCNIDEHANPVQGVR